MWFFPKDFCASLALRRSLLLWRPARCRGCGPKMPAWPSGLWRFLEKVRLLDSKKKQISYLNHLVAWQMVSSGFQHRTICSEKKCHSLSEICTHDKLYLRTSQLNPANITFWKHTLDTLPTSSNNPPFSPSTFSKTLQVFRSQPRLTAAWSSRDVSLALWAFAAAKAQPGAERAERWQKLAMEKLPKASPQETLDAFWMFCFWDVLFW